MATYEQNIASIRVAVYGREVRAAIADAIEQVVAAKKSIIVSDVNESVNNNAVKFSASQSLSDSQKNQARSNIDVYSKKETDATIMTNVGTAINSNAVKYSAGQSLSDSQKNQARSNIDVYSKNETDNVVVNVVNSNAVKFSAGQNLSNAEKSQARSNIDVYSIEQITQFLWFLELVFVGIVNGSGDGLVDSSGNYIGGSLWMPRKDVFADMTT